MRVSNIISITIDIGHVHLALNNLSKRLGFLSGLKGLSESEILLLHDLAKSTALAKKIADNIEQRFIDSHAIISPGCEGEEETESLTAPVVPDGNKEGE